MTPPARPRPPTITDVARRAGVSHQTVSRVLNDLAGVRPETAERVRAAVADLGYRRNLSARLLASNRSRYLGVAVFGAAEVGPQRLLLAFEEAANDAGYQVATRTVRTPSGAAVERAVEQLLELAVEAVVLVVPHQSVLRFADRVELAVPLVVVEGDLRRGPMTAAVDNVLGARLATRHLLELGHPTVVHLSGPPGWSEAAARVEGWRLELQAWGRPAPPLRWGGDWSARSGYAAGCSLARDPDVSAVFAANDQMAIGLLAALREAGRRLPEEVSVVGFDDLPEAPYLHPSLTTVRQDFPELGRRAMAVVERALAGEAGAGELVTPSLVVRSSSAPPASALGTLHQVRRAAGEAGDDDGRGGHGERDRGQHDQLELGGLDRRGAAEEGADEGAGQRDQPGGPGLVEVEQDGLARR